MKYSTALFVALGILLMGCSTPPSPSAPSESVGISDSQMLDSRAQRLPIEAHAILPEGEVIELEVARTPEQQALGLMYREALPDSRGMLFPMGEARRTSFWMQNVPVSLDMIFLRDGEIQAIFSEVPSCDSDPCPTYGPSALVDQVLELRSGRAEELGLQEGDRIRIEFLQ